jgi:hypothetical protein
MLQLLDINYCKYSAARVMDLLLPMCVCAAPADVPTRVVEHTWGASVDNVTEGRRVDIVTACDVMYVREAAPALITTLQALCKAGQHDSRERRLTPPGRSRDNSKQGTPGKAEQGTDANQQGTLVVVAHGRNRFAEDDFWSAACQAGFSVREVPAAELHPDYQADDVNVYHLRLTDHA